LEALVLNVPFVNVIAPQDMALPSVHPPPTPLKIKALVIVLPFVLTKKPVVVAVKVIELVALQVMPVLGNDKLPYTLKAVEPAIVTLPEVGPAIVIDAQVEVVNVQVYAVAFEALLKTTSSVDVGTEAPPAPPEVADQCVVVVSQEPVPPTQYRVAIR